MKVLITKAPELAILVSLGFILRIIGTNPGYFAHGDELMYGEAVYMILNKTLGMEPQILGYYPPLVAWTMLVFFTLILIPLTMLTHISELIYLNSADFSSFFSNYILGKNWINAMYWGRYTTVIFSTGIIVLTYCLTQKIFNKRSTAFLSAFFTTINYRLILNSKLGFIDIYGVFFLLAALLAITHLYQKPTSKKYLTVWIIVGLSFLVKYQLHALLPLLSTHLLISLKSSSQNLKKFLPIFFNRAFLAGGLVSLTLVIALHYYHFQHWENVRSTYEYQALKYGLGVNNLNIFPISYIYHVMLGPILSFATLGGLILGLLQKKYRIGAILLGLPIIFNSILYFYHSTGGSYTRNLLVILPLSLIFAAYFFSWIWEKIQHLKTIKTIMIAAIFLLAATILYSNYDQAKNTLVANDILTRPSGRILIEKWVNENIPEGSAVGVYQGGFAPNETDFSLKTFLSVNEALSYSELETESIEYALLDFYILNNSLVWWRLQPTDIGLRFWNKPDNLLSQSFSALAIREILANHAIQVYLPKWQMPGYNYIVAKIDPQPKREYNLLNKYNFDSDTQGWKKIYYFEEIKDLLTHSSDLGSLIISNENILPTEKIKRIYARPGSMRWESPAIQSQEGHSYKAVGKIQNLEDLEKGERNGFLRLDFYGENPNGFARRAISSYVSKRVFGESAWHGVSIECVAPKRAKFFTVSFQVDQGKNPFYLDDIEVFVSREKVSETHKFEKYIISDDDLFNPNDGGFL